MTKSRVGLVLHLIGWVVGASFSNQSHSSGKQNQNNHESLWRCHLTLFKFVFVVLRLENFTRKLTRTTERWILIAKDMRTGEVQFPKCVNTVFVCWYLLCSVSFSVTLEVFYNVSTKWLYCIFLFRLCSAV